MPGVGRERPLFGDLLKPAAFEDDDRRTAGQVSLKQSSHGIAEPIHVARQIRVADSHQADRVQIRGSCIFCRRLGDGFDNRFCRVVFSIHCDGSITKTRAGSRIENDQAAGRCLRASDSRTAIRSAARILPTITA